MSKNSSVKQPVMPPSIRILVIAVLTVTLTSTTAFAGDPMAKPTNAESAERLTAGNRLYRVREFEKAIEEYKAGALKEDVPVFHYNLAQCFRQLGRYDDAICHYERFLDRGKPTGQLKTAVEDFVQQMRGELQKKAMTQPPNDPGPTAPQVVVPPSAKTIVVIDRGEPWYADGLGWGMTGVGVLAGHVLRGQCERARR